MLHDTLKLYLPTVLIDVVNEYVWTFQWQEVHSIFIILHEVMKVQKIGDELIWERGSFQPDTFDTPTSLQSYNFETKKWTTISRCASHPLPPQLESSGHGIIHYDNKDYQSHPFHDGVLLRSCDNGRYLDMWFFCKQQMDNVGECVF